MMQLTPAGPITGWILLTFIVTVVVVGGPLLNMLVSARRAARAANEKDIAALVGPIIAAFVKLHNEEEYAHPKTFARYATLDSFKDLKVMIEANEEQRRRDVQQFRDDLRELKQNVALAFGKDGGL